MFRTHVLAAVAAAGLVALAAPAKAATPGGLPGPADWLAGAPGPGHAEQAYPRYAQQRPTEPIRFMSVTTLMARLRLGDRPFIVDVRSYPEYVAARLPNAVNIPLDEVERRLGAFPKQGTIVLY